MLCHKSPRNSGFEIFTKDKIQIANIEDIQIAEISIFINDELSELCLSHEFQLLNNKIINFF